MAKNKSQAGDNSISNSGNDNELTQNNYNFSDIMPKRTIIFDLCELIANQNIPSGNYSIKTNTDWTLKLDYNSVVEYTEIFDEYCDIYLDFEEILKEQYSEREKMIRKIHHIYRDVRISYPDKKSDGDFILQKVFVKLSELVNIANYDPSNQVEEEEIDRTIVLIMFYTLTKCKLLEVPIK